MVRTEEEGSVWVREVSNVRIRGTLNKPTTISISSYTWTETVDAFEHTTKKPPATA